MTQTASVERLWTDHECVVRNFLFSRCSSREIADDLTAETFLHAMVARQSGREISLGWLMTVARRRLVDHWRSSYRHGELMERLSRETPGEQWCVFTFDGDEQLDGALARLCEPQRDALLLRYCEGRSVHEVAERLSLSYAATESVLARGRRRLRSEYACSPDS